MSWQEEHECVFRDNEKKVKEEKLGLRQGLGQSATILETKMHGAMWKIQRDDVEPAFKMLSV